ncbi:hypothetical protein IJH02_02000 [Candidatus Saccharibacteria bacterium]|nr:hypothetical protein [Candidatus Saccharibacteria bacterium]
MAFKITLSDDSKASLRKTFVYILYELRDGFAANNLYADVKNTLALISYNAEAHAFCEDKDLSARGIRKIHLKKHKYKFFYHITSDSEVWIDAFLHDKQDFETILK